MKDRACRSREHRSMLASDEEETENGHGELRVTELLRNMAVESGKPMKLSKEAVSLMVIKPRVM